MKPMNDEDQKRRMAALAEGKRIVTKRYRNPVYGNRSLKENVEEEMGNPRRLPEWLWISLLINAGTTCPV